MIADDFATVASDLGLAERFHDGDCCHEARAALERIKAAYQRYLDAASRVTDLANGWHRSGIPVLALYAIDLRVALKDAYLGGPLQ